MGAALCTPRIPRIGRVAYHGQPMTMQYKFHIIGQDGHVSGSAAEHELQNDRSANKEGNLAAVEIWEGARLVAYVVGDVRSYR